MTVKITKLRKHVQLPLFYEPIKSPKKLPVETYSFHSSQKGIQYSTLMLPKDMVENIDQIEKKYIHDKIWRKNDGTLVKPGWRLKIVGRMAEIIHKLVTMDGFNKFKIKDCTIQRKNFKTKKNFDVPYYHLIIEEMTTVDEG